MSPLPETANPRRPHEVTWTHPFLDAVVHFLPGDVGRVVDIGCGRGIGGALGRVYRNPQTLVGVDAFRPYLESLRQLHVYSDLVRLDLSRTPRLPFRPQSFDVGLALEVIEHLPMAEGKALLADLKETCARVIVSTPNEFFDQDEYDANPFQRHLSFWHVRDFESLGFDVYGVGGVRGLGANVGYALGRLTSFFPGASTQLLAVWDRRGSVPPLIVPKKGRHSHS
jgi:SAM-dependent methyltransferase